MVPIEGVDFSAHAPGTPSAASLAAAGKHFVCTYLSTADDWRVMTPGEISGLIAGDIELVGNYEGYTGREMLNGGSQGAADAPYAQANLLRLGLAPLQPIFFSADFDAAPGDQSAIDDYLRGAASIIGLDRVGVYGSVYVLERCAANGTAKWFWQTTAWSGGQLFDGAHLYQYQYNMYIDGVNVDYTQALVPHYGQRSDFLPAPATTTTAPPIVYAKPVPIPGEVQDQVYEGTQLYAFQHPVKAGKAGAQPYLHGVTGGGETGPRLAGATGIDLAYQFVSHTDGQWWAIDTAGNRFLLRELVS